VNTMTAQPIEKFVIAGGGTAGWIAAATLARIFAGSKVRIELVESEEIGIIGVGEATIPPLLSTLESLGIDLVEFIKATQATFKWGIRFEDWHTKGQGYFHPFGVLGKQIDGHDFYQCWLKCRAMGDTSVLMAHSPEAMLAEANKFFLPHQAANTPLAMAQYALHLDSALVGQYLRRYAENLGVVRHEGKIAAVQQHPCGDIKELLLDDGRVLSGEFFIDCTGFRGLLIEQTLKAGYEDWSYMLPCNKAVTVQTENVADPRPYTIARAQDAGWTWQIPLQHRAGNGYVYCSDFISDEQAKQTLLQTVEGTPLIEPRVIPFVTGIRKQPWQRNCLALGLAQGFLEPLESTAIHLVSKTLALFVRMFPDRGDNTALRNEFNRRVYSDYQEIRDFLALHYCETNRSDTEFWRWCQQMPVSDSLRYKLDYFRHSGSIIPGAEELFQPTSWYAVFTGMGVLPTRYNPTVDVLNAQKLQQSLQAGQQGILRYAQTQPSHGDFLRQYCAAPKLM
jgi:tryptophan halogenase